MSPKEELKVISSTSEGKGSLIPSETTPATNPLIKVGSPEFPKKG